jgi:isopentenyl phosphate kinase
LSTDELKILKIGGSVLTEKSSGVFDKPLMEEIKRIAGEISHQPGNLILVHGAGSFGHPYIEKYRLKETRDVHGAIITHMACKRLNTLFCNALLDKGMDAVPIHPLTGIKVGRDIEIELEFITGLIKNGVIPVYHGDVVYNRYRDRFEVLSGDRIVFELVKLLRCSRVGFATDVKGLIINGELQDEIRISPDILKEVGEAEEKSDVTGGMKGKIMSILRLPQKSEVLIFSGLEEGNIIKFLKGEKVGTRLKSD